MTPLELPLIIDLHNDLACYFLRTPAGMDPQTDIPTIEKMVKIFVASIFIEPDTKHTPAIIHQKILEDFAFYSTLAEQFTQPLITITDNESYRAVLNDPNKRGMILHLEGADALTPETEHYLEQWHSLGLRSMGLVWNVNNALGVAAASNEPHRGLSTFGKKIVRKLNELNIIVDCSHLNQAGFYDVLAESAAPPIVTHGNAFSLCKLPRNFTDNQLLALKRDVGIIGVFFSGKYVNSENKPTIDNAIDHVAHIRSIIGSDSVALGTDFGGITSGTPTDLSHLRDIPKLAKRMHERGFSKCDITNIFFGNAKRYLENHFIKHGKQTL